MSCTRGGLAATWVGDTRGPTPQLGRNTTVPPRVFCILYRIVCSSQLPERPLAKFPPAQVAQRLVSHWLGLCSDSDDRKESFVAFRHGASRNPITQYRICTIATVPSSACFAVWWRAAPLQDIPPRRADFSAPEPSGPQEKTNRGRACLGG